MYHLSEKNKTLMQTEKEFLSYVKFITTIEENDTLTLDPQFLSNQVKFKIIMEALTEGSFLKYWSFPEFSPDYQVYNFVYPPLSTTRLKFTIGQILIIYFEQIILLNYEYYYYTNFHTQQKMYLSDSIAFYIHHYFHIHQRHNFFQNHSH